MRNFFAIICAAVLLMAGCGSGGQQGVDKTGSNFSGKEVQLGMLAPLNSDEISFEGVLMTIEEKSGIKDTHRRPKFYDNLKTMQMGLDAGTIEEVSLYSTVAKYIIATNNKYEIVPDNALEKIRYSFCFAVRKDDTELKAELDKAVADMKADGTLDKLVNEYITDVKADSVPRVEIPMIDGAPTIKVGITGDLPPLDLILPDGTPAGFNTAMLAEVARRINRNIELVHIETGARAAALTSKLIDVVFWAVVPFGNDDIPKDIDKPAGLELSTPYFTDNVAHIKLKSTK